MQIQRIALQVLVSLMPMGGKIAVPPVQKLPAKHCNSQETVGQMLGEMNAALGGRAQMCTDLARSCKARRQVRQATKQLLLAWFNSIRAFNEMFTYKSLRPAKPLQPVSESEQRVELTKAEKKCYGLDPEFKFFYRVHKTRGTSEWDSLVRGDPAMHDRLTLVADEGSEGWAAFGFLCKEQLCVSFHRDPSHKVSRLTLGAVARAPELRRSFRALAVLFRASRGPFGSGRFALQLRESHMELTAALQDQRGQDFMQLFLTQIVNDLGAPGGGADAMVEIEEVFAEAGRALCLKRAGVLRYLGC